MSPSSSWFEPDALPTPGELAFAEIADVLGRLARRPAELSRQTVDLVTFFDVDNTLIDNDRIAADLHAHLTSEIGEHAPTATGSCSRSCAISSGMPTTSARFSATASRTRATRACSRCRGS